MEYSKKTVMLVDDSATNLKIGRNALCEQYNVITVPSGERMFFMIERMLPDLILLDVEMPDMSGYEVIRRLKAEERTKSIPVIFLTAKSDPGNELEGLTLGAVDYITKPFSPPILQKRVETHLLLKEYSDSLQAMVDRKTRKVTEMQAAMLSTVSEIVEYRDDITGGHVERTQRYLAVFLAEMIRRGLYKDVTDTWDLNFLFQSAALHDVGKIAIRDSILLKPGKLTPDEFEKMKLHTTLGTQIIERIERSTEEHGFLYHAKVFANSHHEWWDGSGYPLGLKGEEIPLQGRLMAIVDVYDALVSERPYKDPVCHDEAVRTISQESGDHFDPALVELFLAKADEFKRISDTMDLHGSQGGKGYA